MTLTDFNKMQRSKFWALVSSKGAEAEQTFKTLWDKLTEKPLTQAEAITCLDSLFIYTHMRIKQHGNALAKHYPTKQLTPNKLQHQKNLWWVDHFTAGISCQSTLSWFSSAKRKKSNGKKGYAGASTHFVQDYHGDPYYLIALNNGAWHEPRRNKDSIGIEMVNAGRVHRDKTTGKWHYWARKIPADLVRELPPVLLDKPYKGIKAMQPFTVDQIIANIKLKRLIITALEGRLDAARMSQHSDWRAGKSDMGKLWPQDECNIAAYANDPIPELSLIQTYEGFLDEAGEPWVDDSVEDNNEENPEYGEKTPTHDDDEDTDTDRVLDLGQVQSILTRKGYNLTIDGKMGPKTKEAIRDFQGRWNHRNPKKPQLSVDGIPGPQTCARLKED